MGGRAYMKLIRETDPGFFNHDGTRRRLPTSGRQQYGDQIEFSMDDSDDEPQRERANATYLQTIPVPLRYVTADVRPVLHVSRKDSSKSRKTANTISPTSMAGNCDTFFHQMKHEMS